MTEDQKYQGALYKEKTPKKQKKNPPQTTEKNTPQATEKSDDNKKMRAQQAFVEDVGEDRDYSSWDEQDATTDDEKSPLDLLPEAPTPPSAANDDQVNVFDFLVATGQTPNASNINLAKKKDKAEPSESTSLVRYERKDEYESEIDVLAYMEDDDELVVQYGSGPVPTGSYKTPASKSERRKTKDGDLTKDKKRKRLHVEVPGDQEMTDAPPVLHSGLTGGLKGLMRPVLPPSPDYSGGDGAEPLPTSPSKKSKHSKHSKHAQTSNSIFGMIAAGSKTKAKKRKTSKKSSHRHRDDKTPKLIEYRPQSRDNKAADDAEGQMIIFKPRADVFLSFVTKGPESERGCSMNKALKRFHRERQDSGSNMGKGKEEKELWRSLRLRRNDRGEIVLFSEEYDLGEEL